MKFTFLDKQQISGNNELKLIGNMGTYSAEITDFALFLSLRKNHMPISRKYSSKQLNNYFLGSYLELEKSDIYLGSYFLKPCFDNYFSDIKKYLFPYVAHGKISFFDYIEEVDSNSIINEIGTRPVLKNYSEIKDKCLSKAHNENGILEIKYGEYPQKKVDDKIKEILIHLDNNNRLIKTNKQYTIYSKYYNEYIKCPEYILNGKKYIKVPTDKFIFKDSLYKDEIYELYLNEKNSWFEVSPIVWYVDQNEDIAVSKNILFAGINGFTISKLFWLKLPFNQSMIYRFMNTHFAKDIIPSYIDSIKEDSYINKVLIEQKKEKEDKSEVEILLDTIKNYLEELKNKDIVINNINKLIDNYNEKLDLIKDNLNKDDINLLFEDEEFLKKNLIINLNIILDKLKSYYENNHIYHEILNKINSLIEIINKDLVNIDTDDSLFIDFKSINTCISILKEDDKSSIKNNIIDILINERNNILDYLKVQENFNNKIILENNKLNYSTYLEFELILRGNINSILIDLNNKVSKRNIELEINNSIKEIIENIYDSSKNRVLCFYLNLINYLKVNIDNLLKNIDCSKYDIYNSKLLEILNIDIDYNKDLTEILKDINEIIISLNILTLEIENYYNKSICINECYVKKLVNK